jgi:hypothetical protein
MHATVVPTEAAYDQHFHPDILFTVATFLVFWTTLMSSVYLSVCPFPGSVTDVIKDPKYEHRAKGFHALMVLLSL